ncbi:hypothetical protein PoB_000404200 [Plakobranchus ocellatus]|uniref:Uncharacterized protein n=1 Tax=Plakobranchus ocellatus TaxID=259542 RepID=A0AAV3Y492_9GAST|nr:hypothetical protein PoB_000404200 [Plakobranchus ocellatus]
MSSLGRFGPGGAKRRYVRRVISDFQALACGYPSRSQGEFFGHCATAASKAMKNGSINSSRGSYQQEIEALTLVAPEAGVNLYHSQISNSEFFLSRQKSEISKVVDGVVDTKRYVKSKGRRLYVCVINKTSATGSYQAVSLLSGRPRVTSPAVGADGRGERLELGETESEVVLKAKSITSRQSVRLLPMQNSKVKFLAFLF